ncbi:F0F1 ATP synthase subunit epsilon [Roseovarius sp. ZX-A-9]|uniref:F0F1 ATP synthase subunit epsilon n=1 Tax=Roseovarius sp. ZX-A-9 TaxID=3014783 RepID=UPI00232FF2A4|nr:F0F1 ATP synthase subunit epsilon [Roseovarius sp. ZX-A-9]
MADKLQFDLVSPERLLASVEATEVQIPGAEGDMTAMADHAPLITTLRPGIVRVIGGDGAGEYVVTGGFAEINASGVSVLAERAMPRADITQEDYEAMVKSANAALKKAEETFVNEPGPVDDAAKLLADMMALGDEIGLSASFSA